MLSKQKKFRVWLFKKLLCHVDLVFTVQEKEENYGLLNSNESSFHKTVMALTLSQLKKHLNIRTNWLIFVKFPISKKLKIYPKFSMIIPNWEHTTDKPKKKYAGILTNYCVQCLYGNYEIASYIIIWTMPRQWRGNVHANK